MKFYDRSGAEITHERWMDIRGRDLSLALDKLDGGHAVTVWAGFDDRDVPASYDPGKSTPPPPTEHVPPLIFRTLVVIESRERTWRYATEAAARRGHAAVVQALQAGRDIDEIKVQADA